MHDLGNYDRGLRLHAPEQFIHVEFLGLFDFFSIEAGGKQISIRGAPARFLNNGLQIIAGANGVNARAFDFTLNAHKHLPQSCGHLNVFVREDSDDVSWLQFYIAF